MKLKRNLSLIILAGLLTATLASCVVKGNEDETANLDETEPFQQEITTDTESATTNPDTTIPGVITNDPTKVTYTAANDTVYVSANSAALKLASDVTQSKTVNQLTELHRVGIASDWCEVEYEGQKYYVATKVITTDDLGEKTFAACDKTLYVTANTLKIRKYPSTESFSTELGSLTKGTEVKVIAQNSGWSKIQMDATFNSGKGYAFVSSAYLSTDPTGSTDNYLENFTELSQPVTKYVSASYLNIRQKPYADDRGTLYGDPLSQGDKVTVVATGKVEDTNWSMIIIKDGSVSKGYFVATSGLRDKPYGSKATLDDMLAAYPGLTAFDSEKTLWIYGKEETDRVNGRDTPDIIDGKDSNSVITLKKADAVTVVAYGMLEGKDASDTIKAREWALVKDAEKGFFFVSFDCLTTNSDGSFAKPALSLDELVSLYKNFEKITAVQMKAKNKTDLYDQPDGSKVADIPADTVVTVVAQGETGTIIKNEWYIIQYEGAFYFVIQDDLKLQ